MKRALWMLLLLATTLPIAGCIVAPYPGYYGYGGYYGRGGCYYRAYRCY